ncbi:MAG TPA: transposase [Flavobacteriales bacterium]|nr:transposase [Flavobacteriales bacterium]HRE95205.1 transposase [Flavobacteriales bacterium]HRJ35566.1 transposase [Flavobacteriales bacterium]HRJ38648.1 transposase [Flavobacteriales bacterium]
MQNRINNNYWQPQPYIENLHFEESQIYHVYNRANGSELLFRNDNNYYFFLRKIKQYISPVCTIYALCLMPNHFHLLIRIKEKKEVLDFIKSEENKIKSDEENFCMHEITSMQFRRLQISYAKALNKQLSRKGSLFIQNIKRRNIDSDQYFFNVLDYIHNNPVNSGFSYRAGDWKFSSFNSMVNDKGCCSGWIARDELIAICGGQSELKIILTNKIGSLSAAY